MKKHLHHSLLLLLLTSVCSIAQVSIKDSVIATPLVGIGYTFQMPDGDMATRFGNNSAMSLEVSYKGRKQWIVGGSMSYFFGKQIRETGIFKNLATSEGYIINRNGEFADVRLYERGITLVAEAGRMFSFKKPNPNSGIVFKAGIGFMQHKIRIETIGNNVPQLSTVYKKGYDRLSNGLMLSQNLGYMYLSNNRLLNIYFGFECMEGFTQSRRSYDYDLMKQATKKRLDILYGGKIVWVLPLYKKAPQEFYIY